MSYGKKDEDADLGLVKVDRTQVFQEGPSRPLLELAVSAPLSLSGQEAKDYASTQRNRSSARVLPIICRHRNRLNSQQLVSYE